MSNANWAAIVAHARPAGVQPGYAVAAGVAATGMLVPAGNSFLTTPPAGPPAAVKAAAPAYFAGAALSHLEDGWSYLGRSFGALLRGDRGAAAHTAYYAELRAALALLASQGMLVIDRKLYALNAAGDVRALTAAAGTHVSIWELYDRWSDLPASVPVLRDALLPFGLPLGDWLDAATHPVVGASTLAAAKDALKTWALDLQRFKQDQRLRERFSYNPTGFESKPAFATEPYVCEIWTLLEPGGPDPFERLDRHLLRMIVDRLLEDHAAQAKAAALTALLGALATAPPIHGSAEFLRREPGWEHDAALVKFAGDSTPAPWATMARAVILLRFATGTVRLQLDAAGVPRGALAPWADVLTDERKLADLAPVASPQDLWGDVDLALDHMATCPPPYDDTQASLRILESAERVALWSLAA